MPKSQIFARIELGTYRNLKIYAIMADKTVSACIEEAIENFLAKGNQEKENNEKQKSSR
jgi:hypothetical protein